MDATPPIGDDEIASARCGVCDYPRVGLPPGSPCPECGAPDDTASRKASRAVGAARTPAERAWLVSVGLGLALLVVASFFAIWSELFLNIGGLTLLAINAPAPKLAGAALLLREIGNPGPNGVMGSLAALGQLLAVWLITEPPSHRADGAAARGDGLRRATRWVAIVSFGGLWGLLLTGGLTAYAQFWSWHALPALWPAVVFVELPTNVLLYAYLSRLSRRFDPSPEPRPLFALGTAAVLVGATCAGGAAMSIVRGAMEDRPVEFWRAAQGAFGALALAAGVVMSTGVVRLLWHVAIAALDRPAATSATTLARLLRPVRRWLATIRDDPTRLACVAGLVVWLMSCRPLIESGALIDHRRGLGGDLPTLNFVGPKVWCVPFLDRPWERENRFAMMLVIVAVWLMTAYRPTPAARRAAIVARWSTTLLFGLGVGVALTIELSRTNVREAYWTAFAIVTVEAPATLTVYVFLATLAAAVATRRLMWSLASIGATAVLTIASPLVFFALARQFYPVRYDPPVLAVQVVYGALAIAAAVVAWALIVRLTWAIATRRADVSYDSVVHSRA